jgi:hypothetical protein
VFRVRGEYVVVNRARDLMLTAAIGVQGTLERLLQRHQHGVVPARSGITSGRRMDRNGA